MKAEVLTDTKFNGLCSTAFYGNKPKPVRRHCYLIQVNKQRSNEDVENDKPKTIKPFAAEKDDIFENSQFSSKDVESVPVSSVGSLPFVSSVGSQTSFSSSLGSNGGNTSPVCSFRASPFIEEEENSCLFSPDLSESSLTESLSDEKSFLKGNDNSYDCSNISTISLDLENLSPKVDVQLKNNLVTDKALNDSCSSTERTPKKNTILHYFKNSENKKSKGCVRSAKIAPKSCKMMTSSTPRQLTLTSEKLEKSYDRKPFNILSSPRQQTGIKRAPGRSIGQKDHKRQKKEQTYIDIGQKDFGHVTCQTCGMVYTKSQIDDEAQHAKYHQKVVQKLRFNGWKNERVLQEFHDGRIIVIHFDDHHLHLKKLLEVRDVVDSELGFHSCEDVRPQVTQQAYLFISKKKVIGCAIAVPIKQAYSVIPTNNDVESHEKECGVPTSSWCCSSNPVPALCGISRIWVFSQNRRQKIASRIVDCVRHNFLYGYVIAKSKLAFSDPTPNGRIFAEKYIGKEEILIFR